MDWAKAHFLSAVASSLMTGRQWRKPIERGAEPPTSAAEQLKNAVPSGGASRREWHGGLERSSAKRVR